MNLMDKPGNIRIAWDDNGAIDLEVKGDTFDVFCALAAAVSQCVKRNIREEGQVECLKKFSEMLLDLHKMPALVIDTDAIMGGGTRHE